MTTALNKTQFDKFLVDYSNDISDGYINVEIVSRKILHQKVEIIYTIILIMRRPWHDDSAESKTSNWKDGINSKLKKMGFKSTVDNQMKFLIKDQIIPNTMVFTQMKSIK